jgi:NADH-quinone oxidoreductase subunit L
LVEGSRVLWRIFDARFIDGMVNGAGSMMRGFGGFLRPIQTGIVGNYATTIVLGAILIVGYVLLGGGR